MAGIASYMKQMSPSTKIVGAEPLGCPSMMESLKKGEIVALTKIDTFVDGAAVGKPGVVSFVIRLPYLGNSQRARAGYQTRPRGHGLPDHSGAVQHASYCA